MSLFGSSGKSVLSFLQTAVLSQGMYLIQRDALLVYCQHTLLEVISFPEKNMNQLSQASSYKISDAFRICQKAKQAFISAFLDLKAKCSGRRRKLKWRKQGVELDWGMWVFCIPRVTSGFPRAEGDVFSIRMMWPKGGFSSSPFLASSSLLFSPCPPIKEGWAQWPVGFCNTVFPNIFTKQFDFAMQRGADGFNHGMKNAFSGKCTPSLVYNWAVFNLWRKVTWRY